ncbi:uncharacterized protein LOC135836740 [Planococcus citri]|uniref:uncharacterized protein LOC135836740 n=1 Tax=Planococcus citri TaxID=170843 RepID=UPI0031FA35E1
MSSDDESFAAVHIVAKKVDDNVTYYLVKWEDQDEKDENSWYPAKDCSKILIREFEKILGSAATKRKHSICTRPPDEDAGNQDMSSNSTSSKIDEVETIIKQFVDLAVSSNVDAIVSAIIETNDLSTNESRLRGLAANQVRILTYIENWSDEIKLMFLVQEKSNQTVNGYFSVEEIMAIWDWKQLLCTCDIQDK